MTRSPWHVQARATRPTPPTPVAARPSPATMRRQLGPHRDASCSSPRFPLAGHTRRTVENARPLLQVLLPSSSLLQHLCDLGVSTPRPHKRIQGGPAVTVGNVHVG